MSDPGDTRYQRPAGSPRGHGRPVSLRALFSRVAWAAIIMAVLYVVIRLGHVFVPFGLAVVISYVISPMVAAAQRRGAPRTAAIATAYIIVVLVLGATLAFVLPPLLKGLEGIVTAYLSGSGGAGAAAGIEDLAGGWLSHLSFVSDGAAPRLARLLVDKVEGYIGELAGQSARALSAAAAQIGNFFIAPVIAFYLTRDVDCLRESFASWLPPGSREKVMQTVSDIDAALAGWVRGIAIVTAFVGVFSGTALALLKVEYALPLAFIAAMMEVIPYFGPILGLLPAVLMAFRRSVVTAFLVVLAFTAIQQIESAVLSPRIMGDRVGLHPLAVISSVIVGGGLFGVAGMLIAVPATAVLSIIAKSLFSPIE
jgi:predicted PurR-regulated permease PerM